MRTGRSKAVPPRTLLELKQLSVSLRKKILTMVYQAGSGHLAGSLSSLDIMVALYFGGILKYNSENLNWLERDRFLLSAGHLCPALYAVLSEAGFFSEKKLNTLRDLDSPLQGHPERGRLPGIEISAGLLGQGLSIGIGMALAAREARAFTYHVFVLLSDAEHQEGQVWEAIMAAAKFNLSNLVVVVDRNQIQIDGRTEKIMPLEPLAAKYRSFNWRVLRTEGHNFRQLLTALHQAKEERKRPAVVIADTVAGKGVSFMEGRTEWHGKSLSKKEYHQAIKQLDKE